MSTSKKTVIIVGGGAAGGSVARPLSKSLDSSLYDIILINPRPYTMILPPALRMVASKGNDLDKLSRPAYDKLFINDNGKFVQGEVVAIDAKDRQLELKSGEKLRYDVLVLATGNKWDGPLAFPTDPSEVDAFIAQRRKEFAEARNILLIGGGAVGIELAGELRDIWSDKEITIVHRDQLLLNGAYPEKYRRTIQNQLEARNIRVILGCSAPEDAVAGPSQGTTIELNDTTLNPDLIVRTWGGRPNTEVISSSLGQHSLTERGLVKVKPTLQLLDHPNIFAAGDIIDWAEQKTNMKASMGHAPVVVKNAINVLNGKDASAAYKGFTDMLFITNGKNSGLVFMDYFGGITLGPFWARMFKSRDLLVGMLRGHFGY